MLTNDVVNFEQPDPDVHVHWGCCMLYQDKVHDIFLHLYSLDHYAFEPLYSSSQKACSIGL